MKTFLALVVLAAFWGAVSIDAQAAPETRTPSPELTKLNFFVGTWTLQGVTKPSSFGPGGQKFASSEQLEWMPGGYFLVARSYADGKFAELTVIGYDATAKLFTHTSYTSSGRTEAWSGTADEDSWTWTRDARVGGDTVKVRLTIKKMSANAYSFVQELAPATNGSWSVVAEGTGTRVT